MGGSTVGNVRLVVACALGVISSVLSPVVGAALAALDVVNGVCVFEEVDVEFTNPTLGLYSDATTVAFNSTGACAVSAVPPLASADISATVTPLLGTDMNCVAGVAGGMGSFDVPGVGSKNIEVTVVHTGGVWSVLFIAADLSLAGVGVFAQDPRETVKCAVDGGLSSTKWTGAVVFEDPHQS